MLCTFGVWYISINGDGKQGKEVFVFTISFAKAKRQRQTGLPGQTTIIVTILAVAIFCCIGLAFDFARYTGTQSDTQQALELAQDTVTTISDQVKYADSVEDTVDTIWNAIVVSLEANGFNGDITVQVVEVGTDYNSDGTDYSSVLGLNRVIGVRIALVPDFTWTLASIFLDSIGWAEDSIFTLIFYSPATQSEVYRPSDGRNGYVATWSCTISNGNVSNESKPTPESNDDNIANVRGMEYALNQTLSSLQEDGVSTPQ